MENGIREAQIHSFAVGKTLDLLRKRQIRKTVLRFRRCYKGVCVWKTERGFLENLEIAIAQPFRN